MLKQFNGLAIQTDVRPSIADLEGRFAQNGIYVPSTGRWIVMPHGEIDRRDVAEIAKRPSVIETLFFGLRYDQPIIQVIA